MRRFFQSQWRRLELFFNTKKKLDQNSPHSSRNKKLSSLPKVRRIIRRFEGPLVVLSGFTLIFGLAVIVSTDRYITA